MTYSGLSMWNRSSKIPYFMDFWHSFCWRLWRPWMLLSTKSKCHKSNFRISWMYRYCFYDLKVYLWCLISGLKFDKACLNTLYSTYYIFTAVYTAERFVLHTRNLFESQNPWFIIESSFKSRGGYIGVPTVLKLKSV